MVGERRQRVGGRQGGAQHPVADSEAGHALSDLVDHASHVRAEAAREVDGHHLAHEAVRDLPVDPIDACGPYREPYLPRSRREGRDVDDPQHIRSAVLGELHCKGHQFGSGSEVLGRRARTVTDRRAPRGRSRAGGDSARSRTERPWSPGASPAACSRSTRPGPSTDRWSCE